MNEKKYKVLIADDEYWTREKLKRMIPWEKYSLELLAPAVDGEDVLRRMEEEVPDILITDIDMPFLSGTELLAIVQEKYPKVISFVVSGYNDFAYVKDSFLAGSINYLMKPVNEEKFHQVLTRAVGRLARNEPFLTLELPGETVRVPLPEIRYLDVQQNYVTVHAGRDYTLKRPLAEFEAALDRRFFRAGRSCIVNLTCIRRVTRTEAELTTGERIPLPRGQYEKLNRAIIDRI